MKLEIGKKAPAFNMPDQNGQKVRLSSFKGRKVLLYFYPKAMTPGCTRQSISVSEAREKLEALGVVALGVSPDSPERQCRFDEKHGLGFKLLSDEELETAKAYGAFGEKKSFGKTREGVIRSSFLIDEAGKIMGAWYKVKPEDTVPKALALIEEG